MTMISLAHTILPLSLQYVSQNMDQYLAVDLCICFHQLLDECFLMTIRIVTNMITGEGRFRQPLHYCYKAAVIIYVNS